MPASDDHQSLARPRIRRVVTAEPLERRLLCAAGPPAGFVPAAPDLRLYQLTVDGAIAPAGDQDVYSLGRLVAGDVLTLGLPAAGSGRGTLGDGFIELYRAGSIPTSPVRVFWDDDGGSGNDSLMLRQALTTDDAYFVKAGAAHSSWTGTYTLAVRLEAGAGLSPTSRTGAVEAESEPNGTVATADDASGAWRPVTYVSSQLGSVGATPTTRVGEHTYALREGDVVSAVVDSSSALDATLALVDQSGADVFAVDRGDGFRGTSDPRDAEILAFRVPRNGEYRLRVGGNNETAGTYRVDVLQSRDESSVVGRYVFYNNSHYDGRSAAAGPADDAAVAPDKSALFPNQTPTLANVTNFCGGINGVMLDLKGLHGDPSAADFDFAMSTPDGWVSAPAPSSVSRRAGAGVDASDRITLTWPDGAILDRWLRVTLKSTGNSRLPVDDVFLFGNLVGETGGDSSAATVTVADVIRVRSALGTSAGPTSWFDFNRDGRINATDQAVARSRVSRGLAFIAAAPTVPSVLPESTAANQRPRLSAPRRSLYDMIADVA
jgi:hypothetical protein